ncbi:putative bifunctional diguanylate cyclase/phosphodiesterase [Zavarzinia sp.]|uniref:putative bifunctional diguanylate cyclase/phosphodiesterase n=1 Tax=Zavarzinia sp. TaxID=2027920 RepID=UPI0035661979
MPARQATPPLPWASTRGGTASVWLVLIADDDEDIHTRARSALASTEVQGRQIDLLHARSCEEACLLLSRERDIAVALLGVDLGGSGAGVRLLREWRDAGLVEMRVILRAEATAPLPDATGFEIDDVCTKSDLVPERMATILQAGIRGFERMHQLAQERLLLERAASGAARLARCTAIGQLAEALIEEIAAMTGTPTDGIICDLGISDGGPAGGHIIHARGCLAAWTGHALAEIEPAWLHDLLAGGSADEAPAEALCLRFQAASGRALSAVILSPGPASLPGTPALFRLFETAVEIALETLTLIERLDRLAYVDQTLDIPNLNAVEAALGDCLDRGGESCRIALVLVESHRNVAALHGIRAADHCLLSIHDHIVGAVGPDGLVARIGDAFLAVLAPRTAIDADRLHDAATALCDVGGVQFKPGITGVAADLLDLGDEPQAILRRVISALLHVRRRHEGRCLFYDAAMRAQEQRWVYLELALSQALANEEGLSVHLQPKVNLMSGTIVGAEALLRWSVDGQVVLPDEFIPIAEASGQIMALTDFVIRTLGRTRMTRDVSHRVPIAVNLSMVDLNNPGFAGHVIDLARSVGLGPETLEFEVTESIAMQESGTALDQVRALKAAGYRIALDDFGTGYSSLGQFDRLPIDILKIDRSFVRQLSVRGAKNSLAAIVLTMAKTLAVECVAEGIETSEQRRALVLLGCTVGQGFFFGRAIPVEEFAARLAANQQG